MSHQMRQLYRQMEQLVTESLPMTGETFARLRELMLKREELAPKVGEAAPDFQLPLLNGGGQQVRLSALRGQPVALVFGSYT